MPRGQSELAVRKCEDEQSVNGRFQHSRMFINLKTIKNFKK